METEDEEGRKAPSAEEEEGRKAPSAEEAVRAEVTLAAPCPHPGDCAVGTCPCKRRGNAWKEGGRWTPSAEEEDQERNVEETGEEGQERETPAATRTVEKEEEDQERNANSKKARISKRHEALLKSVRSTPTLIPLYNMPRSYYVLKTCMIEK